MRTLTIIIVLSFIHTSSFGQLREYNAEALFNRATALEEFASSCWKIKDTMAVKDTSTYAKSIRNEYGDKLENTLLIQAVNIYQEVIDSFPKSPFSYRALSYKASIEYALGYNNKAKQSFLAVLKNESNDDEPNHIPFTYGGFANYGYRAAESLADIYIADSNYTEAIKYLDLTDKYPHKEICGNAAVSAHVGIKMRYAECYVGLKNYKQAYTVLLPEIFNDDIIRETQHMEMLYELLLRYYSRKEIKSLFENAVANYNTVKKISDKGIVDYSYYILFMDSKIEFRSIAFDCVKEKEKEKQIKAMLLTSAFYKLICVDANR